MQNTSKKLKNALLVMPQRAGNRHETVSNSQPMGGNMLTIREVCTESRISLRQYYRLRARGFGSRVTILDGSQRIARRELERWLRSHTESRVGELQIAYRGVAG